MMNNAVLLIEDDVRLGELLVEYLSEAGFVVQHALTGTQGLALAQAVPPPDVVVLDLMLPDMDGLDVCRQLRTRSAIPILMLTARGDAMDRVVVLEMGADDYVPKPFEPRELLARLRAILRRGAPTASTLSANMMSFGRLSIDLDARQVLLDGQVKELTSYQFDLLVVLAERAGRVLSREVLMEALKQQSLEAFDRSIDVHISRVRAAIEDDVKQPKRILTVRGAGYVFAKQQL